MNDAKAAKPRILAVDDLPANLIALDAVLGGRYEIVHAKSGKEALALLKEGADVDVILLDIQMPEMDGYETAARITAADALTFHSSSSRRSSRKILT